MCMKNLFGENFLFFDKLTAFLYPAKRSFRGVYCFQSVHDSKIPRFRDSVILSSFFEGFIISSRPILFKFSPHLNHLTLHVL